MVDTNRRTFLGATAMMPVVAAGLSGMRSDPSRSENSTIDASQVEADLLRYVGCGIKRAGGPGDAACGDWLAAELEQLGYHVERQTFTAPWFEATRSELVLGDTSVDVYPQPIVRTTGAGGVTGPLVRVDSDGRFAGNMDGAIALVDLDHARWSTMLARAARGPIEAAFAAGAIAAVAITNGPTGKVIALNTDGREPMFAGPVALLAPDAAGDFLAGAMEHRVACLVIEGEGGRRPAFNFVGRLDRGQREWMAISTPRSGWFTCAAERGPGVAAWLNLARWAPAALPDYNLAFICNTGHEYEYLGAAEAMEEIAPPVADTRFWLHIGANVAGRDWHEFPGNWAPLPSVDSQRVLSLSPELMPLAREIFAGQIGYEAPVSSAVLAAGELVEVIRAGYAPAAGVFGIHRYHHIAEDDERCLNIPATAEAAAGFRRLLLALSGQPR